MTEMWQQIAVWGMIAIAAVVAVTCGVNAWRAIKRGECGNCAGCGGQAADRLPVEPTKRERIVFLPAKNLRNSKRQR